MFRMHAFQSAKPEKGTVGSQVMEQRFLKGESGAGAVLAVGSVYSTLDLSTLNDSLFLVYL